ncbi:MAG: thymidine phosphorylase [Pirellulaceae bacterium]|nr:thymidine phosphorylase [Pirellulaceae bacterium]
MDLTPALIIAKKRDGHELDQDEIAAFVQGFTRGEIPDYQTAALVMAIFLRGLSTAETAHLTDEMLASGARLGWPAGGPPKVDKHSTGGIGDKTSLILAPLLACCGLAVPMISGRGLGATGGTLDKLDAIPGFRSDLGLREIEAVVARVGCVITGASADLAPADKKLYALRDVTATVPSIPLIAASIMSKKLAESLDALVLDVKFGSGAFMKTQPRAEELARLLVATGQRMGVKTSALLTDMNQPLGRMAGNLVEVHESLATLAGRGPADLWDCTRELGAELLVLTGRAAELPAARVVLDAELASGRPLAKFAEMIAAQGGDLDKLPPLVPGTEIVAGQAGFVTAFDTEKLGLVIIELGGGRKVMTDKLDHAVGLETLVRIGDRVDRGQPLVRVFAPADRLAQIRGTLARSISIGPQPLAAPPLIALRIGD